jgi:S1-C subfamily serine protease
VLNLSPAVAEELSYEDTAKGVIIAGVASGSNAAEAGFQRGDLIASINGEPIETTKRLAEVLAAPVPYIDLAMKRDGRLIRLRMPG